MILAGDIGGTKTALGIYSHETGIESPLAQAIFPSADYAGLEAIVTEFLSKRDFKVEKAVFGVAGPVSKGKAIITNLPWVIDEDRLKTALKIPYIKLLNDLEATAWSVPFLSKKDVCTLNKGEKKPGGTIAVVAPGTGLGEAFLTWDGSRYLAYSSEGGHADIAPTSELEIELVRYLMDKYEHVSYEWVCSGIGIPNIYHFLKDSGKAEEPDWLAEELAKAKDPTPVIFNAAIGKDRTCPICETAIDIFISILGSEAGNMALKVMATGGVYLGGGIPPRILPSLKKGHFIENFLRKGRMSGLLSDMPVNVILSATTAITGAAYYGLEMF
ncbi:glucokinase [Desulfococcaceae bacterium HSG9]|nr:glucokinase [Desulfococcaceae bacterium HSG9]